MGRAHQPAEDEAAGLAAVEGPAVGGGLELVLSCDLVVASTSAYFAFPEARRGLMPDYGAVFRRAHAAGERSRELLLTGEPLTAERAERLGFVNVLTGPAGALDATLALADKVCTDTASAPSASRSCSPTPCSPRTKTSSGS